MSSVFGLGRQRFDHDLSFAQINSLEGTERVTTGVGWELALKSVGRRDRQLTMIVH